MSDEPGNKLAQGGSGRPEGLDDFLGWLSGELSQCTKAHHVAFAAILSERRLAQVGEYADWKPRSGESASMRQIMQAVWDHACGRPIAPDQLTEFQLDLTEIGILVDPDRYTASASYRGIRLLSIATQCCALDAVVAAAVAVARASLEMAAGSFLAEDFMNDSYLRQEWGSSRVQAEAGLQAGLVQILRAMPMIERTALAALRWDFAV